MKDLGVSGCLYENPFYMVFNPRRVWADKLVPLLEGWLKSAKYVEKLSKLKLDYLKHSVNYKQD